MQCPKCRHLDHRVVDSRTSRGGLAIRRRRECTACDHRFTTYEQVERESLVVRKRNGDSEEYCREKLISSIQVACARRPVSLEDIEQMALEIEARLATDGVREVPSEQLGEFVMERLQDADQVAYVRFASVYRDFQDTTEFMEEVRELIRRARSLAPNQVDLFLSDGDQV